MNNPISYENVPNVRQSTAWENFMKSLGWHCFRTKSGVLINIFKTYLNFFNFGKIQKPKLLSSEDLVDINKICSDNHVAFIKLETNNNQDAGLVYEAGFIDSKIPLSPSATSYIDLTKAEEDLWKDVSRSGKYGINRSLREETRIEIYVNPDNSILEKFFDVHLSTAKRNKFMTRGLKDLKKRRDAFGDHSYLLMAYDSKGVLSGGKFFLGNDDMVLYSQGGTSDYGRSNRSGFSLTWESIIYFKRLNYKVMDFEGMYDPRFPDDFKGWEGFTEFKKKFSPVEIEFHGPFIQFYNPLLRFISKIVTIPL